LNVVQGLSNLYFLRVNRTPVKDLSPLKGMKLKTLFVGPMVKDLSPVFDCPLTYLGIIECPIKDLSFLTNFPALTGLQISKTPVKDLSPLRGMQLQHINVDDVPATNLNILAGMPLKFVQLGHPDLVMDISSLAGKELASLSLYGRVTAFAPLKEVKLPQLILFFDWAKVPDAAKLPEYIPALENLAIPSPGKAEAEIVLRFPNLKKVTITGAVTATMTFDEFKKKFGQK